MRQLIQRRPRGVTLVEMMIALAMIALLATMAAPFMGDLMANSRLRESGNSLYAEALFAQSEAIKRNGVVRLSVLGSTLQVVDRSGAAPVTVRERQFTDGVVGQVVDIDFGSDGMTRPRGTDLTVDISASGITCSEQHRCPRLRIDAGGALRLCGNKLSCS